MLLCIYEPEGCVFLSKCAFSSSKACGVNDVRLFLFLDGSMPMKSVKWFWPLLYLEDKRLCWIIFWKVWGWCGIVFGTNLSSASFIQRSRTGLIFWALFGVMSSFSNLEKIISTLIMWTFQEGFTHFYVCLYNCTLYMYSLSQE